MAEDHFIKKKFKPKPTTQLEIRECKTKLSRADLFQNVTAGNKMFDFGGIERLHKLMNRFCLRV